MTRRATKPTRSSQRPTTVVDIARAVGVTHGTVSRALSGDPRIHPDTRDRILKAAQRLDYRPNLTARAVKSGFTSNLGVFCGGGSWILYNAYFGRLLAGLSRTAEPSGVRVILYLPKVEGAHDANPSHDSVELRGIEDLRDGRVDGAVILSGSPPRHEELRRLRELPFSVVLLGNDIPVSGFFQLLSGAYERTQLAAHELYHRGCRRIGFIGLFEGGDFNKQCIRALEDSASQANVAFDRSLTVGFRRWDFDDRDQIHEALDRLKSARPDALVLAQVEQAIAVEEVLAERLGNADLPLVSFGSFPRFLPRAASRIETIECDLVLEGERAYVLYLDAAKGAAPRAEVMQWRWSAPRVEA